MFDQDCDLIETVIDKLILLVSIKAIVPSILEMLTHLLFTCCGE